MWSRDLIKNYAKSFLRKHYWKAFLVCLIASILTGGNNSNNNNQSKNTNYYSENQIIREIQDNPFLNSENLIIKNAGRAWRNSPMIYFFRGIAMGVLPIMFLIFAILLVTVGFAIEVGKVRFFLKGFEEDVSINNVVSTFNSREYWTIVKTQFLTRLYTVLWGLLLIIPGIIKSYEYSMVPYILSEEPDLDPNQIITRSREMTNGHKWNMFVLDLSFIGWYILGGLLLGIGIFFVNPYKEATYAKLYNVISGNDDNIIYQ